jgi:hypothetical protein
MGFITSAQLEALAKPLLKSGYGKYLLQILEERQDGESASGASLSARTERFGSTREGALPEIV